MKQLIYIFIIGIVMCSCTYTTNCNCNTQPTPQQPKLWNGGSGTIYFNDNVERLKSITPGSDFPIYDSSIIRSNLSIPQYIDSIRNSQ